MLGRSIRRRCRSIESVEERKENGDEEKRKATRGLSGGVSRAATRDETCWATSKESGKVD